MKKSAWIASIVFAGISLAPVGRHVVADEQPLAGYSVESSRVERQWEEKLRAIPDPDKIRSYMQIMSAHPHHVGSRYDKDNAEWILSKFKEFGLDAHIETFDVLFPTPLERVVELVDGGPKFVAKLQDPRSEWILSKFKEFGLDAHIETFDVLFPTPLERVVELVDGGPKFVAKLQEP